MLGMHAPAPLKVVEAHQEADEVNPVVDVVLDRPDRLDEATIPGRGCDRQVEPEIQMMTDTAFDHRDLLELVDGGTHRLEVGLRAPSSRDKGRLRLDDAAELNVVEQFSQIPGRVGVR